MRYAIRVFQRVHPGGIKGLYRIEDRVDVDFVRATALVMEGAELVLALEDGRVLDFFLRDNSGQIENRSNQQA